MEPREIRENAIREAKCNLIMDAARAIFADKGFHEARLEDIAASAGFSKASLYNYYPDKEAIFLSLAIREYDRVIQAITTAVRNDQTLDRNLRAVLATVFTHFGEHFAFILTTSSLQNRAALHAQMCRHEQLMEQMFKGMEQVLSTLGEMIRIARERGEVDSALSDRQIAGFIGALIRGALFEWKIQGRIGDVEETIQTTVSFVSSGIGVKTGTGNAVVR